MNCFLGVDVGTGSVRSAVVTENGQMLGKSCKEISIWSPETDHFEQSSENIWEAVIYTIKDAVKAAAVKPDCIKGIGFDATCSMVVLDDEFKPVPVNRNGNSNQNIVMWMDHRAEQQTKYINATGHRALKYFGGSVSLEMQPPKLLWLKQNLPYICWSKAAHFMDLPDFLTWRSTGSLSRSLCSLVCKWAYQANEKSHGWDTSFWESIGLHDITDNNFHKIGNIVQAPGTTCGRGLKAEVAEQLGLLASTPVGTSLIDAYAGGVGCSSCIPNDSSFTLPGLTSRLTLVCGTSTCHMMMNETAIFVPGVWGPYYSAMVPGMWVSEGGQSVTGKLIDHIVETHPAYAKTLEHAKKQDIHIHEYLNQVLETEAENRKHPSLSYLTQELHVWPDFHGNRSPLADPSLKGMISGLTLGNEIIDLAVLYLAAVQAISYGTKQILEEMETSGHNIKVMYMCGGLRKNRLYLKTQVDVTGLPMILPDEQDSVLIGAAILGASASQCFLNVQESMSKMGGHGIVIYPSSDEYQYHAKKYSVFLKMVQDQMDYRRKMQND